jgi:hypothetical protein
VNRLIRQAVFRYFALIRVQPAFEGLQSGFDEFLSFGLFFQWRQVFEFFLNAIQVAECSCRLLAVLRR